MTGIAKGFALGACLALFAGCVSLPDVTKINYVKVIEVPGVSASQLFAKTNVWAVGYFNKADSVIEFSDKESGVLSGKYIHSQVANAFGSNSVRSMFIIGVKDGKVRIELKPLELMSLNAYGQKVVPQFTSDPTSYILSSYEEIAQNLKTTLTQSSDW